MTAQLVRYEQARHALAEAHRVDEVKDIRDKAEAMAAYARQARDTELIEYATEIKVRAERRCGELLAKAERAQRGDNRYTAKTSDDATSRPTLSDLGLTRDQSSRYQQIAAMPARHFETAIQMAKATAGEVTTAFMLREAKKLQPPKPRRSVEHDDTPAEEPDDPQGFRAAFLLRTEHARNMAKNCQHLVETRPKKLSSKDWKELIVEARSVVHTWQTIIDNMEAS